MGGASAPLIAAPGVAPERFGTMPDGTVVEAYTLTNAHGSTAKILTYGAIIADLRVPDRAGNLASVVTPITPTPENFQRGFPQAAAVMGRVTNRIAHARFTLDGRDYKLAANAGAHHIHGGVKGFAKVNWHIVPTPSATTAAGDEAASITLAYTSPAGEEGYPGRLDASVRYTLTDTDTLRLDYTATTDAPTLVNLTNHAYLNLAGAGDVLEHELTLAADTITEADASRIPNGKIVGVRGTALDFTGATPLGARAAALGPRPNYDHNFMLRASDGVAPRFAARVWEATSGRQLEVWTTEPCVQLYTSDLGGRPLAAGRRGFFCLETQHPPDAIHHANFPSVVLRPGDTFRSTTEFRFSVR